MNKSLLASAFHALVSIAICVLFVLWLKKLGAAPGSREGSNATYLLWSGWAAFALMLIVTAYALRKYIHRLGWSFETKRPVALKALERAEARLSDIRRGIARKMFKSRAEVESVAQRMLVEEKVTKVLKIVVIETPNPKAPGEKTWEIRALPTEPLGRVLKWMQAHIYYGLASGVIVWLHGANSFASPMGAALNLLTWLVIGTGIIGTILFMFGPSWMTKAEGEVCFEKRFVLNAHYVEKIKEIRDSIEAAPDKLKKTLETKKVEAADVEKQVGELRTAVSKNVSEFAKLEGATLGVDDRLTTLLDGAAVLTPDLRTLFQDWSVLIAQRARILAGLNALNRLKFTMNIWRAIHIPASIILLVVVVIHAISIGWY